MYSFDRILIYLKSHTVNLCKKPNPGIPSCPNLLQSQKYTAENASHNYICRLRKKIYNSSYNYYSIIYLSYAKISNFQVHLKLT